MTNFGLDIYRFYENNTYRAKSILLIEKLTDAQRKSIGLLIILKKKKCICHLKSNVANYLMPVGSVDVYFSHEIFFFEKKSVFVVWKVMQQIT